MKKLVIFDLDGTLLDTLGDLCDAVNYAITPVGRVARTPDEVRMFIGNGTKKMIERALGENANEETVAKCVFNFAEYYKDHYNEKTYAYDGVRDCIEMLQQEGVSIGVVTNKLHDISVKLCKEHFGDVFCAVTGDIPGLERKPHPSKILKIMQDEDCDICVMVGDSDVDVQTAKNAGIPCVAVAWGFNSKDKLIKCKPEFIVDDTDGLKKCLLDALISK